MIGLQSVFLAVLQYFAPSGSDPAWSDRHPVVHLPYGSYKGYYNASTNIDVWRSMRYAAPATGQNRWRPPQPPQAHLSGGVIDARDWPKQCPASMPGVSCLTLYLHAPLSRHRTWSTTRTARFKRQTTKIASSCQSTSPGTRRTCLYMFGSMEVA